MRSASALEAIVNRLLTIDPYMARVRSESDGSLPLHFAASIGNIRVVAILLDYYMEAALTHNTKGKIPLHYAAREGRTEMVRFLLRLVPSCAAVLTKKGKLALHFAAGEGHTEVVRDLLRVYPAGAVLPSKKGKIAMHFAARWGHMQIARDLHYIYPECIHALDYDGSNPLHDATREGQLEMAKFLVEECVCSVAMTQSNIRGEIPLFAAIRSGNSQLCAFLIRAWPGSGKQVLQRVRNPDDVASWEPTILDLCLRGAVANFTDSSSHERDYIDADVDVDIEEHGSKILGRVHSYVKSNKNRNGAVSVQNNGNGVPKVIPVQQYRGVNCMDRQLQSKQHKATNDRTNSDVMSRIISEISLEGASILVANNYSTTTTAITTTPPQLPVSLDISLPRSKSPILSTDDCGKRRSATNGTNGNKRQRRGSIDEDDEGEGCASVPTCLQKPTFYQVHAALECSATTSVLKCVLERYPEQHILADDYGRLPLHVAISHCRSEGSVDLLLEKIWKPNPGACFHRDNFGRLPLHLALATRADARLVRVLLEANPSSGVEQFGNMLPIHMATANECDLSTIFMLVRGDPAMVQTWKSR